MNRPRLGLDETRARLVADCRGLVRQQRERLNPARAAISGDQREPQAASEPEQMTFNLLYLPTDVLVTILQQPSVGARELCRLERCSRLMRHLIDDRIWRHIFLQSRRCNALHDPLDWKAEFMRRDAWSRGWRQLVVSAHPPQPPPSSSPPSKLRRFALKIMSPSAPAAPPTRFDTIVVDPRSSAPGSFHTINAALACAKPYDLILVRPGVYKERLRLDKHIELVGDGPAGSVVLVGVDGPTIEAPSRIVSRVANLHIKQRPGGSAGAMSGAVLIKSGGVLVVEECVISSQTGHCIVIQGQDSCGYVLHNEINNGKGVGVLICDHGKGMIEDNDISCNGRAGVAILSGADPHVCANKIHEGMDSGVLVSERGRGRIEDNDIFANRRAGVAILKEGAPLVKHNRIHDGRDSGVLVCENGQGCVTGNDIFANHMAGVAIGRGGASRVTGNTIRDGHGGSLCLSLHSKGLISANVIHQDPRAAMQARLTRTHPLLSPLRTPLVGET